MSNGDSTRLRLRVQGRQRGAARVDDTSCTASAARYVWFHRTEQRDWARPLDRTANHACANRAPRLFRHQRDAGSDSLSTGTTRYHLMADIHCEAAGDLSGYGRDCVFRQISHAPLVPRERGRSSCVSPAVLRPHSRATARLPTSATIPRLVLRPHSRATARLPTSPTIPRLVQCVSCEDTAHIRDILVLRAEQLRSLGL